MKLSLWRNNLTGSIPWALGALSKLEQLNLGENALTGSIPAEVGDLTNLRQLYLAGNALSALIPSRLGDLANLDVLHLRQNALIGPLPGEIENLSNLGWLDVAANGLTGDAAVRSRKRLYPSCAFSQRQPVDRPATQRAADAAGARLSLDRRDGAVCAGGRVVSGVAGGARAVQRHQRSRRRSAEIPQPHSQSESVHNSGCSMIFSKGRACPDRL